ncbi:hypothetical protein BDK51DRAFT_51346 [Blyttiomyces helicus]|uniref:Uncharacterized protein n=1 Tax=Blyttiomyces helicus TaxID=388810 RepID=A0A4P9W507_9FUNG|nr:hypothetical protein BDK51DRAFT_51346 [Blyttiomyces helicus]|eukprot:RKO86383.1 hypothetical protein BDK51DRAFT_51346 [Blyttiomyces helicus]
MACGNDTRSSHSAVSGPAARANFKGSSALDQYLGGGVTAAGLWDFWDQGFCGGSKRRLLQRSPGLFSLLDRSAHQLDTRNPSCSPSSERNRDHDRSYSALDMTVPNSAGAFTSFSSLLLALHRLQALPLESTYLRRRPPHRRNYHWPSQRWQIHSRKPSRPARFIPATPLTSSPSGMEERPRQLHSLQHTRAWQHGGHAMENFSIITEHLHRHGGIVIFVRRDNTFDLRLRDHLFAIRLSIVDSFATSVVFVRANVQWNMFLPDEINVENIQDELDYLEVHMAELAAGQLGCSFAYTHSKLDTVVALKKYLVMYRC